MITSHELSNYFSDLLLTTLGDLLAIDEYLRPTPSLMMKFYSKYEQNLRNEKTTPEMVSFIFDNLSQILEYEKFSEEMESIAFRDCATKPSQNIEPVSGGENQVSNRRCQYSCD